MHSTCWGEPSRVCCWLLAAGGRLLARGLQPNQARLTCSTTRQRAARSRARRRHTRWRPCAGLGWAVLRCAGRALQGNANQPLAPAWRNPRPGVLGPSAPPSARVLCIVPCAHEHTTRADGRSLHAPLHQHSQRLVGLVTSYKTARRAASFHTCRHPICSCPVFYHHSLPDSATES